MTGAEDARERNGRFVDPGGHAAIPLIPRVFLFVVGCLDPRTIPVDFVGVTAGDAFVVRNAGGRVTPEVIRDVQIIASIADVMVPGTSPPSRWRSSTTPGAAPASRRRAVSRRPR